MSDAIHFLWLSMLGIILFGFSGWLYHYKKVHVEITRKVVHIGAGLLSLCFPVFFKNPWWVLLSCALYQLVLVLSIQYGFLKSINAVKRKTYGSIVYPMVVYLVYLAWFYSGSRQDNVTHSYAYFYLPILAMTLCDPLATLIGQWYPIHKFEKLNKSVGGTLAFWIGTFLLSCFILLTSHVFAMKDVTRVSAFIATAAALTELYGRKGMDNFLIPITVLLAMYVVEYFF